MFPKTAQSTLAIRERPDNIIVISAADTSPETLQHWEQYATKVMDGISTPQKRLFDLRNMRNISVDAVRTAVRLRRHPNANLMYNAILTSNPTVLSLVRAALSVSAGGHFKLFANEADAITWLHDKVPD